MPPPPPAPYDCPASQHTPKNCPKITQPEDKYKGGGKGDYVGREGGRRRKGCYILGVFFRRSEILEKGVALLGWGEVERGEVRIGYDTQWFWNEKRRIIDGGGI